MAVSTSALGFCPQDVHQHHESFTLQKYYLLQEQHQSLQQHLNALYPFQLRPHSTSTSPATSPTRSYASSQSSPYSSRPSSATRSHARHSGRRSSLPVAPRPPTSTLSHSPRFPYQMDMILESGPDESTLAELAVEEAKLFDVNESIKRALTELLNCDAARNDRSFRLWVQCRLMETEKELRNGRRRRSAPEV